jgi:hypothetical protein
MSFLFDGSARPRAQRLRLAAGAAVLVAALIVPATATAAEKWLDYPSCTATSTTLTCTGKAAGIARPFNNPLGAGLSSQVEASISARVHYTCADPLSDFYLGPSRYALTDHWGAVPIKNGERFTLSLSPDEQPSDLGALFRCWSGLWTRDPNYYFVSVDVGWGPDAPSGGVVLLTGPIGTVIGP